MSMLFLYICLNLGQTMDGNIELMYKCKICSFECKNRKNVISHTAQVHTKTYSCFQCGLKSASRDYIRQHSVAVHENKKPYSCSLCENKYAFKKSLVAHIKCYHSRSPNKCEISDEEFPNSKENETRKSEDHSTLNLYCPICNKYFLELESLTHHNKVHHERRICLVCGESFANIKLLQGHKNIHSKVKCEVCKIWFADINNLTNHIENSLAHKWLSQTTNENTRRCNVCQEQFDVNEIGIHQLTCNKIKTIDGSNEFPKTCKICGTECQNTKCLKVHIKQVHAKDYSCSKCSFVSASPALIKQHSVAVHEGKKAYSCSHCENKYAFRHDLIRHMKRCHSASTNKCESCHEEFPNWEEKKTHMSKVHSTGTEYCPICNKHFLKLESLTRHNKINHAIRICLVCGESFANLKLLQDHKNKHSKVKCEVCKIWFDDINYLNNHIENSFGHKLLSQKMNEKTRICNVCQELFDVNAIDIHQLTCNNIKKFECKMCNAAFSKRSSFSRHINHSKKHLKYVIDKCEFLFVLGLKRSYVNK